MSGEPSDLSAVTMYTMDRCGHCTTAKQDLAGSGVRVVNCSQEKCDDVSAFPTFKIGDQQVMQGAQRGLKEKLSSLVKAITGGSKAPYARNKGSGGEKDKKLRLYGADWCGWTTKAKSELEGAGLPYEFVDCTKSENKAMCGKLQGYPTMELQNGSRQPGWPGVDAVKTALQNNGWAAGAGGNDQQQQREGYQQGQGQDAKQVLARHGLGPVVVFGTGWCPHCKSAKKALTAHYGSDPSQGGPWQYVDCELDSQGRQLCSQLGIEGYPVIFVNGQRHDGFHSVGALNLPMPMPAHHSYSREHYAHTNGDGTAADIARQALRRSASPQLKSRPHLKPLAAASGGAASESPPVTVYGAHWCGFTHKLLAELKKRGVRYTYVESMETSTDKSKPQQIKQEIKLMNLKGFPVTFVGNQQIDGFDVPKIEAALHAAMPATAKCDGIGCPTREGFASENDNDNDREGFGISPVMGLTMDKQPAWSFYGDPAVPAPRRRFAGCRDPSAAQQLSGGPSLGRWMFRPDGTADLRLE